MQVSEGSLPGPGLSIGCISDAIDYRWLLVSVLPLQREICSTLCPLSKRQFLCLLQHCLVYKWGSSALLLWPTITEHLHLIRNVHHNPTTTCPTAKTGLLGGGAFVSLDSALFWLVALMLADNARHDHFYDVEKHSKAQVLPDGC
ncbi:hypothetical protein ES319_A05G384700v1 [Gossypium barbadense]|uniref:Uncharacterized protein n=2 Tax=Gossypium TaxID=3633 RepID=A0A5J5VZM9_GOSBA|nr:hypothetical protein ES319_A05G384700v1 [Gossypium barbadense]TYH20160.1 hypothetical protein ES288_A05G409200v1 [Gossypium darwinii]